MIPLSQFKRRKQNEKETKMEKKKACVVTKVENLDLVTIKWLLFHFNP
jgi:hypothetical protein